MKPPRRRVYDTDLSDGQWALIEPMIPLAAPGGRPRKAATRDLVDAILYFLRAGGSWRLLPHDLPPWQTVYYYLRRWQREGLWKDSARQDGGKSNWAEVAIGQAALDVLWVVSSGVISPWMVGGRSSAIGSTCM